MPLGWRAEVKDDLRFERPLFAVSGEQVRSASRVGQLSVDLWQSLAHPVEEVKEQAPSLARDLVKRLLFGLVFRPRLVKARLELINFRSQPDHALACLRDECHALVELLLQPL